jgi:uridine kinase
MWPMLPEVRQVQEKLARLPAAGTILVAIDGRAGSGKTTLAGELATPDSGIRVFHADELQLPQAEGQWSNWTPREGAANFVKEEPLRDVLAELAGGREARYRPFDWAAHELGSPAVLHPGGVVVVGGAYTLRRSARHAVTR